MLAIQCICVSDSACRGAWMTHIYPHAVKEGKTWYVWCVRVCVHVYEDACSPEVNIRYFPLCLFRGKNDHIYLFFACNTHMRAKRTYRCWFSPSNPQVLGTKLRSSGFILSSWCLQLLVHFARPPPCFKACFSRGTWVSLIGYTVWPVNTQDPPACLPSSGIPGMCCQPGFFTVGSEDPDLHPAPHNCFYKHSFYYPGNQLPSPRCYSPFASHVHH